MASQSHSVSRSPRQVFFLCICHSVCVIRLSRCCQLALPFLCQPIISLPVLGVDQLPPVDMNKLIVIRLLPFLMDPCQSPCYLKLLPSQFRGCILQMMHLKANDVTSQTEGCSNLKALSNAEHSCCTLFQFFFFFFLLDALLLCFLAFYIPSPPGLKGLYQKRAGASLDQLLNAHSPNSRQGLYL